jgi:hypothetical protein
MMASMDEAEKAERAESLAHEVQEMLGAKGIYGETDGPVLTVDVAGQDFEITVRPAP